VLGEYWMTPEDLGSLSTEWDRKTTTQISKLNLLLDRVHKKGEEVVSLRDGVSISQIRYSVTS